MKYLLLEGSPYQIGRKKAEFDGKYLDKIMRHYDREKNPAFDEWIKNTAIPYVESEWSDINEEIEGYLDISGYDKVFYFKYIFSSARTQFNCTNIVLYTEDAGWVLAKNTDLCHWEHPNVFFYHYKPDTGYEFFVYDYKAGFGSQGMNSAGLCQGGTSASGIIEDAGALPDVGAPHSFTGRRNMQFTASAKEAAGNWEKYPAFSKAAAFLNMDVAGKSYHINKGRSICDIMENLRFPAYCSGFFNYENYQWRKEASEVLAWSKAALRYAENFFAGKQKYYLQDLVDFLRSHGLDWSEYGQWCRHHPQDKRLCTVVSHICIPARKTVLYCHGNPCRNSYNEFTFDD